VAILLIYRNFSKDSISVLLASLWDALAPFRCRFSGHPLNSMPAPKVLLVANTSWYLHNFRLPLLRDLRAAGY